MAHIKTAERAVTIDLSSTDFVPLTAPSISPTGSVPHFTRIIAGSAGVIKVDTQGGDTGILLPFAQAGQYVDIQVTKVYKTGTTCTGNIGAYWGP